MGEPPRGSGPGAITPDGCAVELYELLPPGEEPAIVHTAVPPGASILELGAGAGRMTHPLLRLGHPVVAVDESPEMLARIHGAETVRAKIQSLDLGRRFDVVLLGLGVDGHTASLFPGSPVLREVFRTVAAVHVAAARIPQRLTLTFPVLNAAARVVFLVAGPEKAKIVKTVLAEQSTLPAAMVRPTDGELVWLADRAAAALHPVGEVR